MDKKERFDRSWLPEGVSFNRKEGLYAELGADGLVLHLGVYQDGQLKPGSWALNVAPDGSWARLEKTTFREWRKHLVPPEDAERALAYWSSLWVDKIADAMRDFGSGINLQCTFCEKYQREVRHLIACEHAYICDECISLCNDLIQEEKDRSPT